MTVKVSQAVKDVNSSHDALANLFASFEKFLSRLNIYNGAPLTTALTKVLPSIIVELLLTLDIVTNQVKQSRTSEFVLVSETIDSTQDREICEEASGRE